jgi:AbrB family looped-hinge helix DNA binding protein
MLLTSTVTSKGQVTLPVKVRKNLGLETGDIVIFDFESDHMILRKARNIETYFNTLPPLNFSFKEKLEEEIVSEIRGNK